MRLRIFSPLSRPTKAMIAEQHIFRIVATVHGVPENTVTDDTKLGPKSQAIMNALMIRVGRLWDVPKEGLDDTTIGEVLHFLKNRHRLPDVRPRRRRSTRPSAKK